jgi:CxxC motif-containing protein (DUF1111 family)
MRSMKHEQSVGSRRPWSLVALLACTAVGACDQPPRTAEPFESTSHALVTGLDFAVALPGLSSGETARFSAGKAAFATPEEVDEGLGPVFNDTSCGACHSQAGLGGGSERLETRWGQTVGNGTFHTLENKGGSLQQDNGIGAVNRADGHLCGTFRAETQPPNSNTLAHRRTTPLFGLGLVDATPDAAFLDVASQQRTLDPAIAGRANQVVNPDRGGALTVGKFGWKSQVPTLHVFSGDAYLNEMGITSPQFPTENCPQGDCALLKKCNPVPELNDADGEDVTAFADFMTLLAPPPRGPIGAAETAGAALFDSVGCAFCHRATFVSGSSSTAALDHQTYHPYSDFLLHDMGNTGDGIGGQGQAGTHEMRTAPLWGVRAISRFMHGGSAGSFAEAIQQHGGQGSTARTHFNALTAAQQAQLFSFLNSL